MIETVDLHRGYRIGNKSIEVLHGVDLRIRRGERVFLCGPSGAGKTTLLYTLAGLERPERGLVRIDGVVPIICGDDQGDRIKGEGKLHSVLAGHGAFQQGAPRSLNEVPLEVVKTVEERSSGNDAGRGHHDTGKRNPGRRARTAEQG